MAVKTRVAKAFELAADYAEHARVQRRVADDLAKRISQVPNRSWAANGPRLFEIGCGTGFLTTALLDRGLQGDWLITDLSAAMVDRCAAAMAEQSKHFSVEFCILDGEKLPRDLADREFDIICSSLAFQWFENLPLTLSRLAPLVAPGGVLAFTTLVSGTLEEWDAAHTRQGLSAGGLIYLNLEQLADSFPAGGTLTISEQIEHDGHADARSFLRSVKRIGAGTAPIGRVPLSPSELRRVMKEFDLAGSCATYRVATCIWTRDLRS